MTIFDMILPMARNSCRLHMRRGHRNAERLADHIDWEERGP